MLFPDINSFEYIVEFHDIHLYYNKDDDEKMEYLFSLNQDMPGLLNKKYLLPIDTKSFGQFVAECLEYPAEKLSEDEFQINIIQLVDKYNENYTLDVTNLINKKIGSLLLNHVQYKNFPYFKKIEKQFGIQNKFAKIVDSIVFNSQICYLLIMINNLLSLTKKPIINLKYKIKKIKQPDINQIQTDTFNYLDFIFDYWT